MKKLSLLAGLLCFVFVACCPKTEEPKQEEVAEKQCCKQEHKCCKSDMTDEEKAACKEFCEKWKDFENQPEDVQKELVMNAKAKMDECDAKAAAKKAECEAKKAEFEAKWANFNNLPLEEQKALIDMKMNCKKGGCCKKEGCHKGGEGKKCHKEDNAKCDKH